MKPFFVSVAVRCLLMPSWGKKIRTIHACTQGTKRRSSHEFVRIFPCRGVRHVASLAGGNTVHNVELKVFPAADGVGEMVAAGFIPRERFFAVEANDHPSIFTTFLPDDVVPPLAEAVSLAVREHRAAGIADEGSAGFHSADFAVL